MLLVHQSFPAEISDEGPESRFFEFRILLLDFAESADDITKKIDFTGKPMESVMQGGIGGSFLADNHERTSVPVAQRAICARLSGAMKVVPGGDFLSHRSPQAALGGTITTITTNE